MGGLTGTANAFNEGWAYATEAMARRRERREQLEDEERQTRVATLYDQGHKLALRVPTLTGADRDQAMSQLADIEEGIKLIYHPDRNPGAVQKDWNFLTGLISRKKPVPLTNISYEPTVTPTATFTPPGQQINLSASPDYQTPAALKAGAKLRTERGTPEADITLPSAPVTIPGSRVNVRPAPEIMSRQQLERMTRRDGARKRAALDVAAGGLTPEQEAQLESRKNLAYLTQAVKDYKAMRPNATPEEEAAFFNDVTAKTYGLPQTRPAWKEYQSPDGLKQWFDTSRSDLIPPGYTAVGGESADTRTRVDYAAFKKQHPEYAGTFEQWKVEQGQLARRAVPTSRDDRFIDIQQRRALGQPVSADDRAYEAGYDLYVQKRVTNPILARAAAFNDDRYMQVMDPSDPEKVVFMRAGDAARAGVGTPASIAFQTDKAVTRFFTSGQAATNLGYFNTAVDHLNLLREAGDALNNDDIQLFNKWANNFAEATGNPAPSNFDTVKSAVAGEIAKTFKGTGATDEEIAQINGVINRAESPEQIRGAISYYQRLMGGKVNALRSQFESGKRGQPNFPAASPAAPAATRAAGSKGSRSVGQVAAYFRSHPQQAQAKLGTTSPSEQQVIEYIQREGFTPTRP